MKKLLLLVLFFFTTSFCPAAVVLEMVEDAQGNKRFETRYKLTPKEPDKPYTKYSLYWDYTERSTGNAALFYEQAFSEMMMVESRQTQNNARSLLSKIWDKTVNDPPLEKAFLVDISIPSLGISKITPDMSSEKIAEIQKETFVHGSSYSTWDYSQPAYFDDFESHLDETRKLVEQYGEVFRLMEHGSRCNHCDLGISYHNPTADFAPEFAPTLQHVRSLARILTVKIRLEIAEGKYEDAVKSTRIGMEMAKHIGDQPTLICPLVGIAIHGIMHANLMELLDRPDSPNLYWAVSNRPNPYFNFAQSVQAEKAMLYQMFPLLKKAVENSDSLSNAEWELFCKQADEMIKGIIGEETQDAPPQKNGQSPILVINVETVYPDAKKWLSEQGKTEQEINAMSKEKVVGLHTVNDFQFVFGDYFNAIYLPIWEIPNEPDKDKPMFYRKSLEGLSPYAKLIGGQFYPAIDAGKQAFRRVQLQNDTLRISQAIRIYMAENGGKLPPKLEDIKSVTVPCVDPYTGKAFRYRLENGVGIIDVPEHHYPLTVYFEAN